MTDVTTVDPINVDKIEEKSEPMEIEELFAHIEDDIIDSLRKTTAEYASKLIMLNKNMNELIVKNEELTKLVDLYKTQVKDLMKSNFTLQSQVDALKKKNRRMNFEL